MTTNIWHVILFGFSLFQSRSFMLKIKWEQMMWMTDIYRIRLYSIQRKLDTTFENERSHSQSGKRMSTHLGNVIIIAGSTLLGSRQNCSIGWSKKQNKSIHPHRKRVSIKKEDDESFGEKKTKREIKRTSKRSRDCVTGWYQIFAHVTPNSSGLP